MYPLKFTIMDKNVVTKRYSNGEVIIVWQSGKCIHSGNCVNNKKAVFNPQQSPWIQSDKGSTREIKDSSKMPKRGFKYSIAI